MLPARAAGLAPYSVCRRLFSSSQQVYVPSQAPPALLTDVEESSSLKPYSLSRLSGQFITYKPITPSIRHLKRPNNPHIYGGRSVEFLTFPERKRGGRNTTHGRVTVRFRGGGHKRRIRTVDFKRMNGDPHDVIRIEYDPGRSAHVALLKRQLSQPLVIPGKGKLRMNDPTIQPYSYILAPDGLKAGDVVRSYRKGVPDDLVPGYRQMMEAGNQANADSDPPSNVPPGVDASMMDPTIYTPSTATSADSSISAPSTVSLAMGMLRAATLKVGNVLPLHLIPTGSMIHNIALDPNGPGALVRSAGTFATVVAHEEKGKYTQVRLQSGEIRKILSTCPATFGKVSNPLHKFRNLAKAGRRRWLGFRPRVRGMAMNAVDHPHGGGRGKSKGNKHPRSVWGWLAKGKRTRKPGPKGPPGSNKMVIKERPRGKDKIKANMN